LGNILKAKEYSDYMHNTATASFHVTLSYAVLIIMSDINQ
jgi:hypothetical protein